MRPARQEPAASCPGHRGRSPVLALLGLGLAPVRSRRVLWVLGYVLVVSVLAPVLDLPVVAYATVGSVCLVLGLSGVLWPTADSRRFLAALPVSRAQVVNAWWLGAGLWSTVCLGGLVVVSFLVGQPVWVALLGAAVETVAASLALPVFLGGLSLRRYLLWFGLLVVSVVLVVLLSSVGPVRHWLVSDSPLRWALLAPAALVVVVSWWLSHRLYARQDH